MPNLHLGEPPPVSLEGPIDVGDEVEIDRIVGAVTRTLMRRPDFREDLLPPGRRAWLEAFARRCLEGALLEDCRKGLDLYWKTFVMGLVRAGILGQVLEVLQLAGDPDDKDERRGWAAAARRQKAFFLKDRCDLRDLLEGAFRERDIDEWRRYPSWYGGRGGQGSARQTAGWSRAMIARNLPIFEPRDALLREMRDDADPRIRHLVAVRWAHLNPDDIDDDLLGGLLDAAADHSWTWSFADHYSHGARGYHEALLTLERFGTRARGGAALLRAEMADIRQSYGTKDATDDAWSRWLADATRLAGILEGDP